MKIATAILDEACFTTDRNCPNEILGRLSEAPSREGDGELSPPVPLTAVYSSGFVSACNDLLLTCLFAGRLGHCFFIVGWQIAQPLRLLPIVKNACNLLLTTTGIDD